MSLRKEMSAPRMNLFTSSFTRPKFRTKERFQHFTTTEISNNSLEIFFSRLRELGSKAVLGTAEVDIIKDLLLRFKNEQHNKKDEVSLRIKNKFSHELDSKRNKRIRNNTNSGKYKKHTNIPRYRETATLNNKKDPEIPAMLAICRWFHLKSQKPMRGEASR